MASKWTAAWMRNYDHRIIYILLIHSDCGNRQWDTSCYFLGHPVGYLAPQIQLQSSFVGILYTAFSKLKIGVCGLLWTHLWIITKLQKITSCSSMTFFKIKVVQNHGLQRKLISMINCNNYSDRELAHLPVSTRTSISWKLKETPFVSNCSSVYKIYP